MSVIRKKPFVENLVENLSDEDRTTLKYYLDNGGDNVKVSLVDSALNIDATIEDHITPVFIELDNQKSRSGILIYTTNYYVLIAYHKYQDLEIYKINDGQYEKIYEYCDINELRRIILASNKADLVNGKVPSSQLPSYVDDVVNGYLHEGKFYEEDTYETEIPAEEGKIYVDLATNITYRWSGLAYIQIGGGSIEANPTLAGTEPDLTGLQIGDAKYKVLTLLRFTNVEASTWVSDSTVEGFNYKCVLTCNGVTAQTLVYVKFNNIDATSGNYSSTVETDTNTVTIWSKVNTSTTIPLIKEI